MSLGQTVYSLHANGPNKGTNRSSAYVGDPRTDPDELEAIAHLYAAAPDLHRELTESLQREGKMRAALEMWVVAYDNLTMKSGVCYCGDDTENHDNAMNCGHSPVDCGEEYAASAIGKTRAALGGNP